MARTWRVSTWMFPGFQFLPVSARSYLAPRWPLGNTYGWEPAASADEVMSTELLRLGDALLLPGGRDRLGAPLAGVPKSMTAIRHCTL